MNVAIKFSCYLMRNAHENGILMGNAHENGISMGNAHENGCL